MNYNMLDELFGNSLTVLDILNHYKFEIGILTADGEKSFTVNILNSDMSKSKMSMKLNDIMFFVENGTMMIPGTRIIEKTMIYANNLIDNEIQNIIDNVILNNEQEAYIQNMLNEIAHKIELYGKQVLHLTISNSYKVNFLLNKKDENRYLIDLNLLSKYIKCRVIKD